MQKYYFFANNDTTQHENMHRLRHIALKKPHTTLMERNNNVSLHHPKRFTRGTTDRRRHTLATAT